MREWDAEPSDPENRSDIDAIVEQWANGDPDATAFVGRVIRDFLPDLAGALPPSGASRPSVQCRHAARLRSAPALTASISPPRPTPAVRSPEPRTVPYRPDPSRIEALRQRIEFTAFQIQATRVTLDRGRAVQQRALASLARLGTSA